MKAKRKEGALGALYVFYDRAVAQLGDWHQKHASVFTKAQELQDAADDLEGKIRDKVRMLYTDKPSGAYVDFEGESVKVEVIAKHSRQVNAEGLIDALPLLRNVPGLIVETIDRRKLDELIKEGKIDRALVERFTVEKVLTPAVAFKPHREEG